MNDKKERFVCVSCGKIFSITFYVGDEANLIASCPKCKELQVCRVTLPVAQRLPSYIPEDE